MTRKPVIVVGGPTASGKSSVALAIAEAFNGSIVNADSMQIYNGLGIVTARPDKSALARVPHELYGLFGNDRRCSAGEWRDLALDAINRINDLNRVPILVGGTGLYLRALMTGFHRMPAVASEIRTALNERLKREGADVLHTELASSDPVTASRLHRSDGQRIVRALEVFAASGKPLSAWQSGQTEAAPENLRFLTVLSLPDREELYEQINSRFENMLESGAIEEVESFISADPQVDHPLWKAVGVLPISTFLKGEIDRNHMIERGKQDTRRYAKRQMTWFRHQIIPDLPIYEQYSKQIETEIFSKISNFLLTG